MEIRYRCNTDMTQQLQSKTIWITGASSGVGEGMAPVFHREGADLIISGRREAELETSKKKLVKVERVIAVLSESFSDEELRKI